MVAVFFLKAQLHPLRPRAAVLAALGLDDDGSATFELGRPATGATCLLVDNAGSFTLHLPLLRTPTSARDLLPPAIAAAASLGARWVGPGDDDPLASWDAQHKVACAQAARDGPLPPHLPREALDRLHAWLLAVAATRDAAGPILVLHGDDTTRLAVGLPDGGVALLAPVGCVLAHVGDETRVFPAARFGAASADGFIHVDVDALDRGELHGGEPLGGVRVATPVEIVDDESLAE